MMHGIVVDFALALYSEYCVQENLYRSILIENILYMSKIDNLIVEIREIIFSEERPII